MQHYQKSSPSRAAIFLAVCIVAALIYYLGFHGSSRSHKNEPTAIEATDQPKPGVPPSDATVDLAESQLGAIAIAPAEIHEFTVEKEAIGSVAYHEKDAAIARPQGVKIKFVVASVSESDSPFILAGQPVKAKMKAYPDSVFEGKVSLVGVTVYDSDGNPAIDPATHRIAVRCEIADPENKLYPGMLADLLIQVEAPVESVSVPVTGVVRNGDGTMAAWVTVDRRRFSQRIIKVGVEQEGRAQILEGVKPGELIVTDGAVFLSNILYAPPTD